MKKALGFKFSTGAVILAQLMVWQKSGMKYP